MIDPDVTVIVPTHNRAIQVLEKVKWILRDNRVGEVIVVVDGSTDETIDQLRLVTDPRLMVIVNKTPIGPSRARNAGIPYATRPWVALLDDDDFHSDDFFAQLMRIATESRAAVVGTAWLHFEPGTDPQSGFELAARSPSGPNLSSPSIVPNTEWAECLWLPNNVLVRRSVLASVKFDEGYLGNFWREETDFFVSVARAGHKVVVTDRAYSYQYDKPSGGIVRSNRLAYEYWVARNDIRFMRRHGSWLKDHDYIDGIWPFLWNSLLGRVKPVIFQIKRKLWVTEKRDATGPIENSSGK